MGFKNGVVITNRINAFVIGLYDAVMLRAYWGYYVIGALFLAEIAVTGVSFYSFSLYIRAWQSDPDFAFLVTHVDFHFSANPITLIMEIGRYVKALMGGWSLAAINFAFTVTLPLAFLAPFIGRIIDQRGPKIVMLVGVPIVAVSFLLRAFMTQVWHFWLLQLMLMFGQNAAFIGTGRLVGLWFQKNRSFMMGFAMAGNNVGGIVMAPLSAFLIEAIGWRDMFLVFGVVLLLVNFSVIFIFIRDKPSDVARAAERAGRMDELAAVLPALNIESETHVGKAVSGTSSVLEGLNWREAIRTKTFWLIAVAQFGSMVSVFAILNQLAKHLEIVGIGISTAGLSLAILGFSGLIGKLVFALAAEKYPVRFVFATSLAIQAAALLMLLQVNSADRVWLLYVFVIIYGFGFGAIGALQPLIMLQSFGLVAYATITGVMRIVLQGANSITPPAVGFTVDAIGTYQPVFMATIVFLIVGSSALVFARPPILGSGPALKQA